MVDVPQSVRPRFITAGWYPGRRVPVSETVPADHPAAAILAAFGGLTVTPDREAGEECASDDLAFRELSPDVSIIEVWAGLLGTRLVGVAEMHRGHGELYVATDGRCFGRSCVHDAFYFEGVSFAEAAERALFGRRSRPLLRPDQSSVTLYGDHFTADSTEVYRYR
jgi:SUKH-3 immunity protein